MECRGKCSALWGFLVTSALGTLLHFVWDLSGGSLLTAPVSAVNESVWEHMKIFFWPICLFLLVESSRAGVCRNYWTARAVGTMAGLALIPAIHYTYTGALGQRRTWVDVATFYVAAAAAWYLGSRLMAGERRRGAALEWAALLGLCALAFLFVRWTFAPPRLPIFQDPQTMTYGVFG